MINRLPPWFRQSLPSDMALSRMRHLLKFKVNTICKEGKCPNFGECFSNSRLTFMILGDTCTRDCQFCAVQKSNDKPLDIDFDEPSRIAETVQKLGLKYTVITSVTRDDIEDGGAGIFARTIELIRALNRDIKVEVLIPDFKGQVSSLKCVLDSRPDVVAHNLETVKSLYKKIRPQADYALSLRVLRRIKEIRPYSITKSSLMLGLGETEEEVEEAIQDLRNAHCDILTLGQYLAPSSSHYVVREFITPEKFIQYKELAVNLGFKKVLSGPLVRSSYQAEELYNSIKAEQ